MIIGSNSFNNRYQGRGMGDCKPLPPWQHDPPSHSPGAVSYSLIFDVTSTFLVPTPRNITHGGEKEFENY